jgi:peptidoglycan/xylan/chitin deacetylase (PgdA/CDA1 family)
MRRNNTMGGVDRFGPEGRASALVLTIDNLGEASALQRGEQQLPTGSDPSVTRALPWLLDELDRHELTATFFVEAINCELYPEAVTGIAARGHELGHHGWSHEQWATLAPDDEREVLTRGLKAFESLGLRPRGFRPPGGELTPGSPGLLQRLGFEWCSPAGGDARIEGGDAHIEGGDARIEDGLAYVPFDWELVDAYHLMESFASLRVSRGDPETPADPSGLAARLERSLVRPGLHTLILHPFLMLDDAWAAGVAEILSVLAGLARDGLSSTVPGGVFANWLRGETANPPGPARGA